ncbi:MAG: hypothetical protein SGI74_09680 [Oligoflexia bacterium]|nr:hypothetical protein [Oligoflexia bacterium]
MKLLKTAFLFTSLLTTIVLCHPVSAADCKFDGEFELPKCKSKKAIECTDTTVSVKVREEKAPARLVLQRVQKNGATSNEETYLLDDKEHVQPVNSTQEQIYRAAISTNSGTPRVFISNTRRSINGVGGGYHEKLKLTCDKGNLLLAREIVGVVRAPMVIVQSVKEIDSNRLPASVDSTK